MKKKLEVRKKLLQTLCALARVLQVTPVRDDASRGKVEEMMVQVRKAKGPKKKKKEAEETKKEAEETYSKYVASFDGSVRPGPPPRAASAEPEQAPLRLRGSSFLFTAYAAAKSS